MSSVILNTLNHEELSSLIEDMLRYLETVKNKFDHFDLKKESDASKIAFLLEQKRSIYPKLDEFFDKLWNFYLKLEDSKKKIFKKEYEKLFFHFFGEGIEINTHIRAKPLGYGGDFITMNYIYDYHESDYLGKTTYQKLINNYTCNIDVACSNIVRKNFLKESIQDCLSSSSAPKKILSIGSGSAREIEELISSNQIRSKTYFYLIDFESQAIAYVKQRLKEIQYDKNLIEIQLIKTGLISFLKDKDLKSGLVGMDLIYIFGVFDYLSDRICKKVTHDVSGLLNLGGVFLIANMSLERARHRAYYELFGEWGMYHRKKEEMLAWVSASKKNLHAEILHVDGCKAYHFLKIMNS